MPEMRAIVEQIQQDALVHNSFSFHPINICMSSRCINALLEDYHTASVCDARKMH